MRSLRAARAMEAPAAATPRVGSARRRREQGRRASAKHVAWLLRLFQAAGSHHTSGTRRADATGTAQAAGQRDLQEDGEPRAATPRVDSPGSIEKLQYRVDELQANFDALQVTCDRMDQVLRDLLGGVPRADPPPVESPVSIVKLQDRVEEFQADFCRMDKALRDLQKSNGVATKVLDDVVLDLGALQLQEDTHFAEAGEQLRELRDSLADTDALAHAFPVTAIHGLGERVSRVEELLDNRPRPVGYYPPLSGHRGPG